MQLKEEFGLGYRISINPSLGKESKVIEYVRRGIPGMIGNRSKNDFAVSLSFVGAQLISDDGGFLVFGLPDIDVNGAEGEFLSFVQMGVDK